MGDTVSTMRNEISTMLASTAKARLHRILVPAMPETALLRMASHLSQGRDADPKLCQGILPALQHLVKKEGAVDQHARVAAELWSYQLSIRTGAIVDLDPRKCPTDAHGSEYYCKVCLKELGNSFFHCEGCEIMQQCFDICIDCFALGLDRDYPTRDHTTAVVQHPSRSNLLCACTGSVCPKCHACIQCQCSCHKSFSLNRRWDSVSSLQSVCELINHHAGPSDLGTMLGEEATTLCIMLATSPSDKTALEKSKQLCRKLNIA